MVEGTYNLFTKILKERQLQTSNSFQHIDQQDPHYGQQYEITRIFHFEYIKQQV